MKLSLLALSFLFTSFGFAQITTNKINPISDRQEALIKYDSLKNYLEDEPNQYIGQLLYLKKINPDSKNKEYFVMNNQKDYYDLSNIEYKCKKDNNTGICSTDYSKIQHKYYTVFGVSKHPNEDKYSNEERYYLGLREKESKDECYYLYDSKKLKDDFPFIVTGYYIKLKKYWVNKELYVNGLNLIQSKNKYKDLKSKDTIQIKPGDKWTCVDLTQDEETDNSYLILQNDEGRQIAFIYPLDEPNYEFDHCFLTRDKLDAIKQKYGEEFWKMILEGKVAIGWTKDMCKLSLGEPKFINQTITKKEVQEEWIFDSNYIFTDDKLTKINKH